MCNTKKFEGSLCPHVMSTWVTSARLPFWHRQHFIWVSAGIDPRSAICKLRVRADTQAICHHENKKECNNVAKMKIVTQNNLN